MKNKPETLQQKDLRECLEREANRGYSPKVTYKSIMKKIGNLKSRDLYIAQLLSNVSIDNIIQFRLKLVEVYNVWNNDKSHGYSLLRVKDTFKNWYYEN